MLVVLVLLVFPQARNGITPQPALCPRHPASREAWPAPGRTPADVKAGWRRVLSQSGVRRRRAQRDPPDRDQEPWRAARWYSDGSAADATFQGADGYGERPARSASASCE